MHQCVNLGWFFQIVNTVCWMVASVMALSVLYGLYNSSHGDPMSLSVAALYNAVSRTVWGLAVAWVIFACVTGNGGMFSVRPLSNSCCHVNTLQMRMTLMCCHWRIPLCCQ